MLKEFSIVDPESFGKAFLSEKKRLDLERRFNVAGINYSPFKIIGYYFYFVIFLTVIAFFLKFFPKIMGKVVAYSAFKAVILTFFYTIFYSSIFIFFLLFIGWIILNYFLSYKITVRTRQAENILEDYLRYVVENLKGGLSFEKALWSSVKPDFGVLAEEIHLVTKKVMTGTTLEDALIEFTEKYDSPLLKRSFDIIIESLRGGGKISDIIEDLTNELSSMKELKQELVTTNMSYSIFVNAVVLFITPFLFSLSTQFILVLNKIGEKVGGSLNNNAVSSSQGLNFFSFSGAALDIGTFKQFSIAVLAVNAIGAAFLTTIINSGDWKEVGLKILYYPIISIILYLVITSVASNFFLTLIPV